MNSENTQKIVTRFAPSPTGLLHVGSARTALFNDLFAHGAGGKMILRIEDTDTKRSEKKYEENILLGLKWLGIKYDELYRQSERGEIYKSNIQKLIDAGAAYISKEETGESREVIRLKNPGKEIIFNDIIRGEIKIDTTDLGDFVIAKDLEHPLYHLAVVADDIDMGVTHVIRGEDGISNTPRQILIYEALGATRPEYAHIPLILAADRSKLSKRHGAISTLSYQENGYLPEALVNFLAMLGWNPGTDQEIFSKEELMKIFDLKKVQKGGAIFNTEKLNWFNHEYLQKMPQKDKEMKVESILKNFYREDILSKRLPQIIPTLFERISTLGEIEEKVESHEIDFFFQAPDYRGEELLNPRDAKKAEGNEEETKQLYEKTTENIDNVIKLLQKKFENVEKEPFSKKNIKEAVWDFAEKEGRGAVLWPMRFGLSGKKQSPDPFTLAEILGLSETLSRLSTASKRLKSTL